MNSSRRDPNQRPTNSSVRPKISGGRTERIHVGGVEERDAGVRGGIHDRERGLLVALISERHRAEAQPRHLEAGAAETNVLHATTIQKALLGDVLC